MAEIEIESFSHSQFLCNPQAQFEKQFSFFLGPNKIAIETFFRGKTIQYSLMLCIKNVVFLLTVILLHAHIYIYIYCLVLQIPLSRSLFMIIFDKIGALDCLEMVLFIAA